MSISPSPKARKALTCKQLLGISIIGFCAVNANVANAALITKDALSDFSTSNNANGPWSYSSIAVGDADNSNSSLMTGSVGWGNGGWYETSSNAYTTIYDNTSYVAMHPGNGDFDVMIEFDVSGVFDASQTLNAQVSLTDGDTTGGADKQQTIWFYQNNSLLASADLANGFADFDLFNSAISFSDSDIFYLRLNSAGINWNDTVGVNMSFTGTSTAVSESGTIALLGMGLLSLLGFRKK